MARIFLLHLTALVLSFGAAWSADDASAPAAAAAATPAAEASATPAAADASASAPAAAAATTPAVTLDTLSAELKTDEGNITTALNSVNETALNTGDNCWVLVSSALVLLMTLPGLALFYGGMVRKKNVLGTMMQSLTIACIVSVLWAICAYSFAFGPGATVAGVDLNGKPVMDLTDPTKPVPLMVPATDGDGYPVLDKDGNQTKMPVQVSAQSAMFWGGNAYILSDKTFTDSAHHPMRVGKDKDGNWLKPADPRTDPKDNTTLLGGVATFPLVPAPNGAYCTSINHGSYSLFQLMFAIITPALICGGYGERMKFSSMCLFSGLWLILVYCPLAHMVWGQNGLFNWGAWDSNAGRTNDWAAFDFAGGTVVHISSGIAALMCALFLGKRKGLGTPMPPHNLTLTYIGACLLWVGWFGFNAGSALQANGLAVLAFANTHMATAAAALSWPLAEWILKGKPTVLGACSGAVAGLVAITPASGFVTPIGGLILGAIAGVLCMCTASYMKAFFGYDDTLDAFGVHAIGGMWGAIATGIFFNVDSNPNLLALNPNLYSEIVSGQHHMILGQAKAVCVAIVLSAIGSSLILVVLKYTIGIRVSEADEEAGLDLSQHGEEGYHNLA